MTYKSVSVMPQERRANLRARKKRYYQKHKEEIKAYQRDYHKKYYLENPEKYAAYRERARVSKRVYQKEHKHLRKEYLRRMRKELLAAYGGKCSCCGEERYEFLVIDHIHGEGNIERRKFGKGRSDVGSSGFLWFLVKEMKKGLLYKDKYRVLCYNCNNAFAIYGYCPHGNLSAIGR